VEACVNDIRRKVIIFQSSASGFYDQIKVEAIYGTRRNHGTSDKFLQNFVAAPDGNNVLEKQEPEGTKKLKQTAQK
jgi:hypothetical protein